MSAGECPDDDILAAFACSNLPPSDRAEIEAHLARCRECREAVAFVIRCGPDLPDFLSKDSSDR
jgi:anti-sigma factor RsiW